MRTAPPKRGLHTKKSSTQRPSVRMKGVDYGQREKSALGHARRERALAGLEEGVAVIEAAEAGWPSATTPDLSRPFEIADLSKAEIRERMSEDLGRCACYPNIVQAVADAAGRG
jgi:hypothetical protein